MSSGMPELGSKISLISKADIRYEGRLFTVDPQECTIALASVRSFGTEDRETQFPVAPQNQVYDYILFRGSDIKDIRVVNNVPSMPNDPAIMQLSVPASLGGGVGPQYAAPQYAHPVVGSAQYPPYHPMTGMQPGMRPMKQPSELAHHQEMAPAPVQQLPTHAAQVKDQADLHLKLNSLNITIRLPGPAATTSMLDLIGGGNNAQPQNHSRSATPSASVPHRKSPTADQGTQVGSGQGGQRDSRRNSNNAQRYNQHGQQHGQQQGQQHTQQQGQQHGQHQGQQHSHQQNQSQQRNRPNSHNRNQNHQQHPGGQREQGQQSQQQGQQPLQQQNAQQQHGQQHYGQQGQHPMQHQGYEQGWRGRGGGGGAWRGRGGARGGRGGFPQSRNKLKFDNDYDFEQANTEFEELRNQLVKVKIGEEVKAEPVPVLNQTLEKKEDSGNETGAGEPEPEDDRDDFTPYDKAKSFFDNISCEAVERQKGRSQRTDWRTERKLNSETFGVASARRGAWRGRGGWRQYPQHQPWRAGGRGGRGRGGGNMLLPNSTGIPNNSRQPRQHAAGAPAPASAPAAQTTAAK